MLQIRPEHPNDTAEIRSLITTTFKPAPFSDGIEADIIDMLRDTGSISLSLVAQKAGKLVGQITFSAVSINGQTRGWTGLGPLAVLPEYQGIGIGTTLVDAGLTLMKQTQTQGCVVLGNPRYYKRFGFVKHVGLHMTGAPTKNFLTLPFTDDIPSGEVLYHQAFYQTHA